MPVFEREAVVDAPFEEVWAFHSRATGLEALTPDWMNLRVESIVGPDGERAESRETLLEAGSRVHSSIQPFGVGPSQRWTSVILEREEGDGEAYFRDEMREGPFPHWVHTHSFEAVDGGARTRIQDHVEYELPMGPLGRAVGPFGRVGLEPMFCHRHRRTKELLE